MAGWYLLLLCSGYFAVSCGIEILAALVWGVIGVTNSYSGRRDRITRYETERFKQCLFWNVVGFIFSVLFFAVAGYAIRCGPS